MYSILLWHRYESYHDNSDGNSVVYHTHIVVTIRQSDDIGMEFDTGHHGNGWSRNADMIYIYTHNYMYVYIYIHLIICMCIYICITHIYIYIMNKRANGYGASKKGLDGVQWLRTKTRINKQPECIRKMRTWAVTRGISQKQSILYYKPSRLAVPGGKPSWMAMQRLAVSQQHLDLFQNTDTKIPKFIMFTPWSSTSP